MVQGIIMGGMYGTLGGENQTVPRAELWAMYVALSYARKPFRIVTDHLNHVHAISKGKAWCLDAMNPHRDLWGLVWDLIDSHGGISDEVQFQWQRAHLSIDDADSDQDRHLRGGNSWADQLAG